MQIIDGIPVWGSADEATLAQIKRCAADSEAAAAALMADNHKGYSMPIGGVIAYRDAVSPSGVGYDISCGIKGVKTNIIASEIRKDMRRIMDEVARAVVFGVGRTSGKNVDHELFDDPAWRDVRQLLALKQLARQQLGTVGSGNHFVDILEDEEGRVWVTAHFGSRGLGHKIASGFLNLAHGRAFDAAAPGEHMDQPATVISMRSELGQSYWQAMGLAGRYAYAGRDFVVQQVLAILGAEATDAVHNHHNYCIAGTELIPTPDGPKRMDAISAGDTIYAWDAERGLVEASVLAQWCSGEKPIVTIETSSRRIRVSPDHPILTIDISSHPHPTRPWFDKRVGRYVWKRAGEIAEGNIIVGAHGYYNQQEAAAESMPRMIGAFLGDGWVRHDTSHGRYTVGLAIGGLLEYHTERYTQLLEQTLPPATWRSNTPGAYGLTCSSRAVWEAVNNLGLAYDSKQKRVPSVAFSWPVSDKLALLAGYVDADGSIGLPNTRNHGRGTMASTNRDLIASLRELAIGSSLGVTPINSRYQHSNFVDRVLVHTCVLRADAAASLDLWHQAKRSRLRTTIRPDYGLAEDKIGYLKLAEGTFAQRVRRVSISNPELVYDLTVDHPSHAFVCEGIVVHNCWKEPHAGEDLYVVRKGATPAWPGQRGVVGGSMGDITAIVEGVASAEAQQALYSTVHGAGRVMSRTQAAGKRRWVREGDRRVQKTVKEGQISRQMMHERVQAAGVELRGAGTDESPHVYRPLRDVLEAHAGAIKVLHILRPMGVAMAPEDVEDPYKD